MTVRLKQLTVFWSHCNGVETLAKRLLVDGVHGQPCAAVPCTARYDKVSSEDDRLGTQNPYGHCNETCAGCSGEWEDSNSNTHPLYGNYHLLNQGHFRGCKGTSEVDTHSFAYDYSCPNIICTYLTD